MVVPAIRILGTDEQIKRWEEDCIALRIIAAYAQTEIGHGSDVQNLETTATFDKNTDEFVIHTPSITATKCTINP
jgi:acyl-CoA oxidase